MKTTRNRQFNCRTWAIAAATGAIMASAVTSVTAQDVSRGEARAAIRSSGHACQQVVEMTRSGDDPPSWIVRCNSGQFAVTANADSTLSVVAMN